MPKLLDAIAYVNANIVANGAKGITGTKMNTAMLKALEAVAAVYDDIPVVPPAPTLNSLLPAQGSNAGKILKTDGSNASWQANTATLPYTAYRAILNQPGATAQPTVVVIENSTPYTFTWGRNNAGFFSATLKQDGVDHQFPGNAFFKLTYNDYPGLIVIANIAIGSGTSQLGILLRTAAGVGVDPNRNGFAFIEVLFY